LSYRCNKLCFALLVNFERRSFCAGNRICNPSDPVLTKVAECLYRNGHGPCFALIKVRGKQIKRSLKTSDAALARRRPAELRTKAHGLAGEERGMTFDHSPTGGLR